MLYRMFPRGYRNRIDEMIELAGMKSDHKKFINKAFVFSLIISGVIGYLVTDYFIYVFAGVFAASFAFMNAWLYLAIEKRKGFVENVLPDALELMAANIRSGFIPSRAIMLSARPEFGPLSEAIRKSGKDIMTGRSFSEGLAEIPRSIKSQILEHTIKLISDGSKAGGQLVSLLEENAIDIRRRQAIQKEVRANILMYGIFIVFAGILGAPVLFSISGYLMTTMTSIGPSADIVPESLPAGVKLFSVGNTISPEFFFMFSMASLIVTAIFSGLIIGLLNSGKEKGGIKYIPIFLVITLVAFFASRFFMAQILTSFRPV